MTKTKAPAIWVACPGVRNDGIARHSMRDHCWNCAPFWEVVPLCPEYKPAEGISRNHSGGHGKLTDTGYCKACKKHYDIRSDDARKAMYAAVAPYRVARS